MTLRFPAAAFLALLILVACRRCEGGTHQQGMFEVGGPGHKPKGSHDDGRPKSSRPRDWKAGRFPYVCSIRQRGKRGYLCSGFLIEPEWVVTAASCVDPTVTPFGLHPVVYCGAYSKATLDRKRLFTGRGIIHPNWTGDYRKGFDIALLKLNRKTSLSFPEINTDTSAIPSVTSLTALGWTRKTSGVLQISADLPYIDREACQKSVSFQLPDHVICVGIKAKDTLKGDVGGPLLLPDEGESIVDGFADLDFVLGVASGHNTYPANSTAIYTSIGHFWDWIEHVVHGKPLVHKAAVQTKHSCSESDPPRRHQPDAAREEKKIPVEKTPPTVSATPKTKPPEKHRTHLPSAVEETVPKEISSPKPVAPAIKEEPEKRPPAPSKPKTPAEEEEPSVPSTVKEEPEKRPPAPSKPKPPPKKAPSLKPVPPTKHKPIGTRYAGLSDKDLHSLSETVVSKIARDDASAVSAYLREGWDPDSNYEIMAYWSYGFISFRLLHWAAYYDSPNCTEVLIEFGANVDGRDYFKYTPLHIAARFGSISVAKVLLKHGADVDALGNNQNTPLIYSCKMGNWDIAEFLIDKGANVQARNKWKETVLHYASKYGGVRVVKLLISKGVKVDARDDDGKTPLWLASYYAGHSNIQTVKVEGILSVQPWLSCLQALLNAGASKTAKAKDGTRPYDVVCKYGYCYHTNKKQLRDLLDPSSSLINERPMFVAEMLRY